MMTHPELMLDLAKQHQKELIGEAEQHRLLTATRRYRRTMASRRHE
jgi:hypothetical protein